MQRILTLSIALLVGCGGSTATSTSVETGGASRGALVALEFERWYVVRESSGGGLPAGSGVRFREGGFDVTSRGLAQSMAGECVMVTGGIDCSGASGPLEARTTTDGTAVLHQGPLELVILAADAESASSWTAAVGATETREAACRAAANCCIAIENELGVTCELNGRLGDRSTETCRGALTTLRAELASRSSVVPADCR